MELVLVVLTAPAPATGYEVSPQILADILWANADPSDGLEHINVRAGVRADTHIVGLYLIPRSEAGSDTASHRAMELCRRAITSSPALAHWTAAAASEPTLPPSP